MARFQSLTPAPLRTGMGPIVFMVIVFAVMVVALVGLDSRSKVPKPVPVEEHPIEEIITSVTPWDPDLDSWGPVRDEAPDGQRDIPVAALRRALDRVSLRSWESLKVSPSTVVPDVVGFGRLDMRAALSAPSKLRGAPVEVVGTLLSIGVVDTFDTYGDYKFPDGRVNAVEGLVRIRETLHGSSALVKFTLTEELAASPEGLIGRPIKLQGIFFKLQKLTDGGEFETGAWLVAKAIYPSFEIPESEDIRLTLLDDVIDANVAEDVDQDFFGQDALFHLLGHVVHNRDAIVEGEARTLKGREIQKLLRNPDEFRGEVLEFTSRVLKVDHFDMEVFFKQNAKGDNTVDEFWNTYVTVDGQIPVTVMWPKDPGLEGLERRDQVRIRGIFYRNWGYRAGKDGFDRMRVRAPLVIGVGEIIRADVARSDGLDPLSWGIGAFVLLVLGILAVVLRADRRRSQLFSETRRAKRQITRGGVDLNDVADKSRSDEKPASTDAG